MDVCLVVMVISLRELLITSGQTLTEIDLIWISHIKHCTAVVLLLVIITITIITFTVISTTTIVKTTTMTTNTMMVTVLGAVCQVTNR